MSLLEIIVQAVQSLRQRRGAVRARKRAEISLEQLDHRQLLAVTFTGNVINDFPKATPAAYLTDPNNIQPTFPTPPPPPAQSLQDIIKVSGFAVDQIAVNYDQATDTLNVGFLQPGNQKPGLDGIPGIFPVIAGDADNNGDNSTTDPAAAAFGVKDDPGISQAENFNAVIDLSGGTNPLNESIFAGIPNNATLGYTNSTFVVAPAVFNVANPLALDSVVPKAGAELTANEGNIYVPSNDPRHGALELSITHFSQLYQSVTGQSLNAASQIAIGASAGSGDDLLTEEIFHFVPAAAGTFTTPTPVPPTVYVPVPYPVIVPVELFQPTILINPHENRHINTAHYDNIRVTVLSSSSFDSRQIDPTTVRFGGAAPIAEFSKIQLRDGLYSTTFVFKGTDVNLPGGFTVAPITGQTYGGVQFSGAELVFNRNDSYYSQGAINSRDARLARIGASVAQEGGTALLASQAATAASAAAAGTATPTWTGTSTVQLTPRQIALEQRLAARQQAHLSTVAARSFAASSTPTTLPAQSTSASAALNARDLALQSMSTTPNYGAGAA